VVPPCEHGNEPSDPIKGGEFLDKLSDYQVLKKDSAPWSQSVGWVKPPRGRKVQYPSKLSGHCLPAGNR
jgi:hypothetical protein